MKPKFEIMTKFCLKEFSITNYIDLLWLRSLILSIVFIGISTYSGAQDATFLTKLTETSQIKIEFRGFDNGAFDNGERAIIGKIYFINKLSQKISINVVVEAEWDCAKAKHNFLFTEEINANDIFQSEYIEPYRGCNPDFRVTQIDIKQLNQENDLTIDEGDAPARDNNVVKDSSINVNDEIDSDSENTDKSIFTEVDVSAVPPGGFNSFYTEIASRLTYPPMARRMGISGKVYVQFIVYPDGSLNNPTIIKGIGAGCDEEVLKAMATMPSWSPPILKGKKVKQKIILPITFSLGKD